MDISLKDKTKSNSNFQKTRALTKEEIKTRLISKIKKQQRNKKNHKTICCRESKSFLILEFKTYIKEKF